jgi:hypothetical protein
MPALNSLAVELADNFRSNPNIDHGKLRIHHFTIAATTEVADPTSVFNLLDLPQGRVRLIPSLSRITATAMGASRTLALGHAAYATADASGLGAGQTEPLNATAFAASLDTSSAVTDTKWSGVTKYDMYSKAGARLIATLSGGTAPIGTVISGFVAYTYD